MEPGQTQKVTAPRRKPEFKIEIDTHKQTTVEDELLGPANTQQVNTSTNKSVDNNSISNQRPEPLRSTRYQESEKENEKPKGTPGRKNKTEPWVRKSFNISERHSQALPKMVAIARQTFNTNYNERHALEAAIELLAKVFNVEIPPPAVQPPAEQ
jgi:predicted secreted protein